MKYMERPLSKKMGGFVESPGTSNHIGEPLLNVTEYDVPCTVAAYTEPSLAINSLMPAVRCHRPTASASNSAIVP